jgi:cytochrome c peroxidase
MPDEVIETSTNPLKIFKNQVNYSTKLGKYLYYDTVSHKNDIYCNQCNQKYVVTD